jgi:CheY-like chemotaxis protein
VTVASRLGQGSTFTLYLPRAAVAPIPVPASSEAQIDTDEGHILLVEDNRDVAQVTETMLVSVGYEVTWVSGPQAALDLIDAGEPFDAVLSDIVMEGGLSGLDLAQRLRERWPALPVLLMTGYSEALATGSSSGWRVLSKPFREAELVAALRAVRAGAAQTSSNVIRLAR